MARTIAGIKQAYEEQLRETEQELMQVRSRYDELESYNRTIRGKAMIDPN